MPRSGTIPSKQASYALTVRMLSSGGLLNREVDHVKPFGPRGKIDSSVGEPSLQTSRRIRVKDTEMVEQAFFAGVIAAGLALLLGALLQRWFKHIKNNATLETTKPWADDGGEDGDES